MASFDEQLPEWNEPGVEPPQSKKDTGYQPGDKPPAQWMNWFMTRVYKVLQEIRAKVAFKADVGDMSTVPTTNKTAAGAITELFTNVSDGKALVASAITDKGVPTDAEDTFAEMADNIEAIQTGPNTSDATAVAGDILAPKTAYGAAGTKLTGTLALSGSAGDVDVLATKTYYSTDAKTKRTGAMVNRGAMTLTPGPVDVVIPAGYHNGTGKVPAVVVPADKVLAGTTIAGTAGSMPNLGAQALTGTISLTAPGALGVKPPQNGYYSTGSRIDLFDTNFIAANILVGKSIFGLTGSLVQGLKHASGSATGNTLGEVSVNGLAFRPKIIILHIPAAPSGMWRKVYLEPPAGTYDSLNDVEYTSNTARSFGSWNITESSFYTRASAAYNVSQISWWAWG